MRKSFEAGDNGRAGGIGGGFLSPRELAARWRCSRSSADRIAARARLTRLCLGDGRNGIVRYLLKEVETFERSRLIGR